MIRFLSIHHYSMVVPGGPRRGMPDFCPRPCPSPTAAQPGSEEKVRVLLERAEQGVELWHTDDVTAFPSRLRLLS